MKSKSHSSSSSKPSLDNLVETLLKDAAEDLEETPHLKWEWDHYLRLSSLIQKIKERELARDSQDYKQAHELIGTGTGVGDGLSRLTLTEDNNRRAAELPEFIQWLKSNHVELEKISIGKVNDDDKQGHGLGLKTKVPLKTGELAFAVPKTIILSAEKARSSKLSVLIDRDPILHNMQNVLLAVFLLYEKYVNPDSFWKPYLRIIPSTFDTIAFYTEEEMTLLKINQRAFRESLRMYKAIARQYAYFHTKFKNSTNPAAKGLRKILTYNRYVWAVSAVSTRVNNWPNSNDTLCMIPLLDLCNHGEGGVISTDYDDSSESFLCYAAQDFDKNTEFKMFYGHRSSIDFLIHNGFVPNNYRDDIYLLDLSLGTNHVNYRRKVGLLNIMRMEAKMTFQLTPEQLVMAKKLFAFINIFIASEEKLKDYLDENGQLVKSVEEPTPECLQYLYDRLELMRRVSENSLSTTIKAMCGPKEGGGNGNGHGSSVGGSGGGDGEFSCSNANRNLLQFIKNELKLLEMLVHSCKEFKSRLERVSSMQKKKENETAEEKEKTKSIEGEVKVEKKIEDVVGGEKEA